MLSGSLPKSRYHKYYQLKSSPLSLPSRILKFKRPKWALLKQLIFRNQKFNSFWKLRSRKWVKTPLYTSKFRHTFASLKKNGSEDFIFSSFPSVLKKLRYHQPWFKRTWHDQVNTVRDLNYVKWYLKMPFGFQNEDFNTEAADCLEKEKNPLTKGFRYSKVKRKTSLYFWGLKHVVSSRAPLKHSDAFQRRRSIRHELSSMFDFGYTPKFNIKNSNRLDLMKEIYVKPLYTLDTLLFYLRLYPSISAARRAIQCGFVLVNNKKVTSNVNLQFGDMVTYPVMYNPNMSESRRRYYAISSKPIPFLEFDGSTGFFIVNKEYNALSYADVMLVATKTFISRNVFSKY